MRTILVVDDEPAIAQMLKLTLEDEGYRVLLAMNGRDGLDLIARQRPSLVLCDIMMPVMDGRELCRRMQEHDEYSSIPVILMSAVLKSAALSYDCAAMLPKPFDIDVLLDTIEHVLQQAEATG